MSEYSSCGCCRAESCRILNLTHVAEAELGKRHVHRIAAESLGSWDSHHELIDSLSCKAELKHIRSLFKRIFRRDALKVELDLSSCLAADRGAEPCRSFESPVTFCLHHYRKSEITSRPYKSGSIYRLLCILICSLISKHELTVLVKLNSVYSHLTA